MKRFKRIVSLTLAFALCLSLAIPVLAVNDKQINYDDITANYVDELVYMDSDTLESLPLI